MKKIKQFVLKSNGSALIMTIVLTVMLAAVAVMFVAVARMDKASTSNIAANKMLDSAAMSIVELINQQLIYDVPGVAKTANISEANFPQYFDYKDYPDACDPWLASSEPYQDKNEAIEKDKYKWHQISDFTGYLKEKNYPIRNIKVKPVGLSTTDVVREYPIFDVNSNGVFYKVSSTGSKTTALEGVSADADGDGIADSKWIDISNLRTSTGRVFAAVRVIDNGGMANVNTAYRFNPTEIDANKIDGSSQMQINLDKDFGGLLRDDLVDTLHNARRGTPTDPNVEANLIWDFNSFPENGYRPFDSSDELELRYRYCIDSKFTSRFETFLPHTTDSPSGPGQLYNTDTVGKVQWGIDEWFERMTDTFDPNNDRDRRHLLTTYNCDRLIAPDGNDMININDANTSALFDVFRKVYDDANTAAQIAINIHDYRDNNSDVNVFTPQGSTKKFYGFERPCVYISEIAFKHQKGAGLIPDANFFAIELHRPYPSDTNLYDLSLRVCTPGALDAPKLRIALKQYWTGTNAFFVASLNKGTSITVDPTSSQLPINDPNFTSMFENTDEIILVRHVDGKNIVLDRKPVPLNFVSTLANTTKSVERDIKKNKHIRRLWEITGFDADAPTLGTVNQYINSDANVVQEYPANKKFTNVGQLGMLFKKPAYYTTDANGIGVIGYDTTLKRESAIRVNIADANTQQVFKYLTAMECSDVNDRVKGRININTAPVSVIAQLPWVAQRKNSYNDPNLAKAIVAYRDKMELVAGQVDYTNRQPDPCGFDNIGQLMNVINNNMAYADYDIRSYALDGQDQPGFPDLSTKSATEGDEAKDDFEERDLIFARISDLVTVRSDVFTAYILVRVGTEGPQKRYVAILDRSEVRKPGDKVKIRAFQLVPDAR